LSAAPITTIQTSSSARYWLGVAGYLLRALIGAYGLSVLLHLILNLLIGERWLLIALFNTFAHLLWIPALVLLPLSLLLRQWRLAVLLIPAVAAFLVNYGGQFIPRDATVRAAQAELTLLTFNVMAQRDNFDAITALIREADADIVVLQEISQTAAEALPRLLADTYPHADFHARANPTAGMGLLSRYPIQSAEYWRPVELVPQPLGYQRATIILDGPPLTLYNAHPSHPGMVPGAFFDPTYRGIEIRDLLSRAADATGSVILAGDFNLPDLTDDYAAITARYQDAYKEAGWGLGWTFPDATGGPPPQLARLPVGQLVPIFPVLRLDYVFYRGDLRATAAEVWPTSAGSDHRPVRVRFALE